VIVLMLSILVLDVDLCLCICGRHGLAMVFGTGNYDIMR
jgi:hypothetical protein